MIRVGQIRKDTSGSTSYLTTITPAPTTIIDWYNGEAFDDLGIIIPGNFQPNTTYYLRFAVQRVASKISSPYKYDGTTDFDLILCKSTHINGEDDQSRDTMQTISKNLKVEVYNQVNKFWKQFDVVFTPNDQYPYLWIKVVRGGYDVVYKGTERARVPFIYTVAGADTNTIEFGNYTKSNTYIKESTKPLADALEEKMRTHAPQFSENDITTVKADLNSLIADYDFAIPTGEQEPIPVTTEITGEVSSVTNIFGGNINAVQIGIQSRPGSLFIINQEPIYLGRSGVYEVNNGTIVTSVGIAAPGGVDVSKIQDFILDYAVNEEG